jgi:hypothetical protein
VTGIFAAVAGMDTRAHGKTIGAHVYGFFIALIFNCFSFFFTAHSYQRVEKIQSILLQIGSAFSQNAAC